MVFVNPELQLRDTESAIITKLIELLTQLRGFKFMTTLVLAIKKIEGNDKAKYGSFYSTIFCKIYLEFTRYHWKSWFEMKV